MARVARMAIDLALVSISSVKPLVTKAWMTTKNAVHSTKANQIVDNPVVSTIENSLDSFSDLVIDKLRNVRGILLPIEEKYLLKELENVRRKMRESGGSSIGANGPKTLRPAIGTMWQYAKIEIVPPMTISFFNGPAGRTLENTAAKFADGFIGGLERKIKNMDEAEARKLQEKEEARKAAEEKAKAQKLAEEKRRKEAEAKKATETKKAEVQKKDEKAGDKKSEVKASAKPEVKKGPEKKVEAKATKADKASSVPKKDPPKKGDSKKEEPKKK